MDFAFSQNHNMKSVILPKSMQIIGTRSFFECSSLETAVIPDSVTEIQEGAFEECISLKTIYYEGTEDQWNSIIIDEHENKYILNAEVIYEYHR